MLMDKLKRADLLLLLLYVAYCGAIILRVNIEGTGYTSPDSEYYLELAQNLKDGNGFYMSNQYPIPAEKTPENQIFFSAWPVGYPLLIYIVSSVTTLDVFWASKIVNLLVLALIFLTFRHLNRAYSYVLSSIFCSYTLIENYSYTWSEATFILGVLWLVIILHKILNEIHLKRNIILLLIVCLYLFFIRYIGLFTAFFPLVGSLYYWIYKRDRSISLSFILVFIILIIIATVYFGINYLNAGTTTGGDRLAGGTEPMPQLAFMFSKALLNELLIIRNFSTRGGIDLLFLVATSLQITVAAFVILKVGAQTSWQILKTNSLSHIALAIAAMYFILVACLRSLSPFDALDFRILSPFTFLLYFGLTNYIISLPDKHKDIIQAKYVLFAFFLLSLFLNLPKKFILQQLQQLM